MKTIKVKQREPKTNYVPRWGTIRQLADEHDFKTYSGWRSVLFKRKDNGLDKHCRKIGASVLVDLNAIPGWIDSLTESKAI